MIGSNPPPSNIKKPKPPANPTKVVSLELFRRKRAIDAIIKRAKQLDW